METLRYPTLQAWADGICNAVRAKDGTADPIDHQDVPDRILAIQTGNNIDLSGITAQQSDVSERVQYIDATGELKYGTMPEITAETITLDGGNTECAIEEGHHDGGGKVRIVPETLYAAPSRSTQELDSPAGKVYTKVILDPIPDIYKDVSAADAVPGAVLNGYTFYGKSGELESGNIVTKNGKQGATVSANGNRYIPVGYHDGTTYITVNVPQEIVTVEGEDSSGTTAVAADIRKGKTARSKGKLVTGTMPDVELPISEVTLDKDYSTSKVKVTSLATVPNAGYIQAGYINGYLLMNKLTKPTAKIVFDETYSSSSVEISSVATVSGNGYMEAGDITGKVYLAKYTGATTVTPGSSKVTLDTSGKYLAGDIVVEAAAKTHKCGTSIVLSQKNTFTITGVTKQPDALFISLNDAMVYESNLIHEIYHSFLSGDTISSWRETYYTSSGSIVETLYRDKNNEYFNVTYSNNTITVTSGDYYFFKGTYNWMWG